MQTFSLQPSPRSAFIRLATIAGVLAIIIGAAYAVQSIIERRDAPTGDTAASSGTPYEPTLRQTAINDDQGAWLATFTWGSRTVLMRGPLRTFTEPTSTNVAIKTTNWVRLYPTAFDGSVDQDWVDKTVEQNNKQSSPDILQLAMQYIANAKPVKDAQGHTIAGDASYGPLLSNGDRQSGADFNDFIGLPHTYGTYVDPADPKFLGSLDNTGFIRMVWGYRSSLPMSLGVSDSGIPRQADDMLEAGPGTLVADDAGQQITDFSRLQPGDIIFNDTSHDNSGVDQVGMYLGTDTLGNHRFISSRQAPNGPTLGDIGGASILDGNGLYARSFHAIRRF